MSLYLRNISYIDYYENDMKQKNIGHTKVEVREDNCTININLKGLQAWEHQTVQISALHKNKENQYENKPISTIVVHDGKGEKKLNFSYHNIAGISFDQLRGFRFTIDPNRYGIALFPEKKEQLDKKSDIQKEEIQIQKCENVASVENILPHNTKMQGDVWSQLCSMYPVVHPLNNKQEFISICPKDFVMFTEECQKLVHNSFLLHGFYNYQHIILGQYNDQYYIGVPGTFYEREAMVANMFGFEGFEGVDEKETGAFGYYMAKVHLNQG